MQKKICSLDKSKIKFLFLEGIHLNAINKLKQSGYSNIITNAKALTQEQLEHEIKDTHIIGIRSRSKINDNILNKAEKLIAVGCFCIGTNQVSVNTARNMGIPVFNAPFANTRSVAELVIGHIIYLLRGIPKKNRLAHAGEWQKTAINSFEVRGKTLGIIGYGHIGSQLSVLAEGLGMNVIFYDIEPKLALGNAKSMSKLSDILKQADIISLHVPETKQTENLLNKKNIALIKNNSIIINASRGKTVDLEALASELQSGRLLGAAIDVYPVEPAKNGDDFFSSMQNLDNVILTPHIGGSTVEAQERIANEVTDKLIKYSDNGSTLGSVNFPLASLPEQIQDSRRILHIHENKPGILSHINNVFEKNKINILSQYLQTKENTGYVVMDINNNNPDALLKELKNIPGTIKTRVLY